ncbi:MAG: ABC transporter permease [Anaerolineales bacterium]
MTTLEARPPPPTDADWKGELERVGLLRRALRARKWYGGDWWFVAFGAALLTAIITLAIVPQWFAPFDPTVEVGPRLLAPGEVPDVEVVIGRAGENIQDVRDFSGSGVQIGVVQGEPSSQVMLDRARVIADEFAGQGLEVVMRPRPARFQTLAETLEAVEAGQVLAAVISLKQWEIVRDQYSGLELGSSLTSEAQPSFVLGTNAIGQDVLSRLIWGTRIALTIGFSAAILAVSLGVPIGLMSGFLGGRIDRVLTVVMDSIYSFPSLILAIAIAAVLGPSIGNIIAVIGILYVPTYFRIVRGQTLSTKEQLYVEAATSLGATRWSILWRYVFPNVIPSVGIILSVNVADAILTGAGLSFLGLGLPPDKVDWGIDVARGQPFLREAWWLITAPGVMIMLVTLAFTMMGESLAEIFNPRLAEQ